jgi:hypothetical protein
LLIVCGYICKSFLSKHLHEGRAWWAFSLHLSCQVV